MRTRSFLIIFMISLIVAGVIIDSNFHQHSQEAEITHVQNQTSKKVVLLVIDSLMDESLKQAIEKNKAPALAFFMKHGNYSNTLVSSYPTMSVTIDSSIITGTYPDQHKIPALIWFDKNKQRIISYGNGFFEILKLGPTQIAENSLYHYNNLDLSPNVTTIHEELDRLGKKSASINALIYRGNVRHTLKIPKPVANFTDLPEEYQTKGPTYLSMGRLLQQDPKNKHTVNRFGLNDAYSAQELIYLLKKNILPAFTILYFPENDHPVHKKGPETLKGIEELDEQFQKVLNAYPTWEDALENMVWIIIGDSNQSSIKEDKKEALIDLRDSLQGYKVLELGEKVSPKDELVITANERMAYIYNLGELSASGKIASTLNRDSRIAWIAWKDDKGIHVISPHHEGMLSIDSDGPFKDEYQQNWSLQGNVTILDMKLKDNYIDYGDYPDALARLYGAMHSQEGEFLIADAEPGYEFVGESSPDHVGGGAHGSMHKVDSVTPILVTGTDKGIEKLRMVDLKEWILELLE
ncbi:alkaline phosphatase family protein [Bacillus tianshenii]|uniref:alkaline phosphatase family protein n=1 Tax=Sutcliffiella tianshenii TaxID=1463404 RepID=UPI001CD62062|nr:alkaline phosphatase family protein [Bacillus tianshenii]MCA1321672.1 alkaline phosphatase family protein [Bacillus tianshenii]